MDSREPEISNLEFLLALEAEIAKPRGRRIVRRGNVAPEIARLARAAFTVFSPFRNERDELALEEAKPRIARISRLNHVPSLLWSEAGALRFHDRRKIPDGGEAAAKARLNCFSDFDAHVLFNFAHVETTSFRPKDEHLKWNDDDDAFLKWREAATGFPIVEMDGRRGERHCMNELDDIVETAAGVLDRNGCGA